MNVYESVRSKPLLKRCRVQVNRLRYQQPTQVYAKRHQGHSFTQRDTASRKERQREREREAAAGTGARTALSCSPSSSSSACSCSLWSECRSILGALSAPPPPASSPSRARRAASLASAAVAPWQSRQWPPQSGQPAQKHFIACVALPRGRQVQACCVGWSSW
jgi:hypothetical protein|eukprot:COSAG06_NODE_2791_length_6280_cov_86.969422_6_plen_163_part_00